MPLRLSAFIVGLTLAATHCDSGRVKKTEVPENSGVSKIYALKYGESLYTAKLVNTPSRDAKVRLNWLAYLVEHSDGKRTLVDCGFSDPKLLRRFAIQKFRSVTDILSSLSILPGQIDRIILTHTHFDHALDVDKFPQAQIILHTKEFTDPEEPALKPVLTALKGTGRIHTTTEATTIGGLKIEPALGHTPGSLVVRVAHAGKDIVFTGDECYFAESCHAGIPLPAGAVYSAKANRQFIQSLSPQVVILTGHETEFRNGRWLTDYVFFFF